MSLVTSAINERHGTLRGQLRQFLDDRSSAGLPEFIEVAAAKLLPSCRIVAEEPAQVGAGRDAGIPSLDCRIGLSYAARPQAVDEDPDSVVGCGFLIRALDPNHARRPFGSDNRKWFDPSLKMYLKYI